MKSILHIASELPVGNRHRRHLLNHLKAAGVRNQQQALGMEGSIDWNILHAFDRQVAEELQKILGGKITEGEPVRQGGDTPSWELWSVLEEGTLVGFELMSLASVKRFDYMSMDTTLRKNGKMVAQVDLQLDNTNSWPARKIAMELHKQFQKEFTRWF